MLAVQIGGGAFEGPVDEACKGDSSVNVAVIEAAGVPVVWFKTCVVMGSLDAIFAILVFKV